MIATTIKYLIDTNILVYAYDPQAGQKQARALEILDRLVETGSGALSTQVLSEFYVVVTRKLSPPFSATEAAKSTEYYLENWIVLGITPQIVSEALRGIQRYQMSYWDALIWATARVNGVSAILTEDMNTGSTFDGVQIINPLSGDAELNVASY